MGFGLAALAALRGRRHVWALSELLIAAEIAEAADSAEIGASVGATA